MGDLYGVRHHYGVPPRSKFNLTKNQLKLVIFFSLVLVFLIWNSTPFGRSVGSPEGIVPAEPEQGSSLVVREAELFGAYARQHEDSLRVRDGRSQIVGSRAPLQDVEPVPEPRETEERKKPDGDKRNRTELISQEVEERQTLKLSEKPKGELELEEERNRLLKDNIRRTQVSDDPSTQDEEPEVKDRESRAQEEPKALEEELKAREEAPKALQEVLKALQEALKALQEEPKALQEALKALQEAPKSLKEAAKALEEAPKALQEAPKALQEAAKALEEAPKALQEEPKALKEESKALKEESKALKEESKALKEEPKALKEEPKTPKQISRLQQEGQTLNHSDDEPEIKEEEGDLTSNTNINRMEVFEEIRSQSLPFSTIRTEERNASCDGKYFFVYDLPPEFNVDLAARCDSLFPSFNLCDFFADSGIGKPVDTRNNGSQIFVPADRWYNTHQYALELVSHARIQRYKCLTKNPDQASLFYIPFYGGLDVIRWNFAEDATIENRDALSLKLLQWLEKQPSWTRRGGLDHVLVLGKISWDFRRRDEGNAWGSRLLELPETQKLTKVLIERNPWSKNDIGVPHPTFFHPRSARDIHTWLTHIRSQSRTSLVTFVGKERPGTANVRSELVKQCRNATSCRFVECNHNLCQVPAYVTRAFLTTHFCMQPVGDSPTRRSVFDSLIAGCIPVLFHPCTAYVQYPWHLPKNESSWSVYISEDEVKRGDANVIEILSKIPEAERDAMRRTIIDSIIPGLLYSAPGSDIFPFKDAFDITIEQLLHRVSKIDQSAVL